MFDSQFPARSNKFSLFRVVPDFLTLRRKLLSFFPTLQIALEFVLNCSNCSSGRQLYP